MSFPAWIVLGLLVLAVLVLILLYNRMVRGRIDAENAWSQIDVQLKRRHDLIPNLVESVKGAMKFEQETLQKVMEARSRATGSTGATKERMQAENEISGFMGRLLAVWENYPDLKSNKNALALQEELTSTENKISFSRGHYNDVVADYNAMLQQIPTNFIGGIFGFEPKVFFEAPEQAKAVPQVKF